MKGTWRKTRNGWVVVDAAGDEWVAENTLALLPIFEGMRQEDQLLNGDGTPLDPLVPVGLLNSMRGAALAIVKGEGERGREGESQDTDDWMDPDRMLELLEREGLVEAVPEPSEDVSYVPATDDGYEFPEVRGPSNGKREILCPAHGWQRAEVKDGAYRCQFKPSPRQVCQEPGTPKEQAEKRLVAG